MKHIIRHRCRSVEHAAAAIAACARVLVAAFVAALSLPVGAAAAGAVAAGNGLAEWQFETPQFETPQFATVRFETGRSLAGRRDTGPAAQTRSHSARLRTAQSETGVDGWSSRSGMTIERFPLPDAAEISPTDRESNSVESGPAESGRGTGAGPGWARLPQAMGADTSRDLFDEAAAALAAGRIDEAQRMFERLVASDPRGVLAADARRHLGRIYARTYPHAGGGNVAPAIDAPDDAPRGDAARGDAARAEAATGALPATSATENRSPIEGPVGRGDSRRSPGVEGGFVPASVDPAITPAAIEAKPWRNQAVRTQRFEAILRGEIGDRIFFGVDSADVGTRARSLVDRQAQWLQRYPELFVVIEGHADEPGDAQRNLRLSADRARHIGDMLIAAGVPADRIDIEPLGDTERVAQCASSTCKAQNRRTVTRLMLVLPDARRTTQKAPPGLDNRLGDAAVGAGRR